MIRLGAALAMLSLAMPAAQAQQPQQIGALTAQIGGEVVVFELLHTPPTPDDPFSGGSDAFFKQWELPDDTGQVRDMLQVILNGVEPARPEGGQRTLNLMFMIDAERFEALDLRMMPSRLRYTIGASQGEGMATFEAAGGAISLSSGAREGADTLSVSGTFAGDLYPTEGTDRAPIAVSIEFTADDIMDADRQMRALHGR